MTTTSTDDVLTKLKPLGRLQFLLLLASSYVQFFTPMVEQCIVFLAATPEHHCRIPSGYFKNQSIPLEEDENGDLVYSSCQEYRYPGINNETEDCQNGREYSTDVYGETIISEWDLVCTNNPVDELGQSVLQIGGLVGAFMFGMLADRYGRRLSLFSALVLYNVAGIVTCFSPGFVFFLVLRFINGIAQMGVWGGSGTLVSEYMIPKHRNISMTVPTFFFSFGLMLLALMAFLIRDWRYLQLAITLPVILVTVAVWLLPESLRWLMSKNRTKEVETLIEKLAKINGVDVPTDMCKQAASAKSIFTASGETLSLNKTGIQPHNASGEGASDEQMNGSKETEKRNGNIECQSHEKSVEENNYLDLFKPPVLHVTIVLSILRFSMTIVYFGFALSTGRLSGDPYLNFFYSAAVEVPARISSLFIYKWFPRPYILSFCKAMCFVALTCIIFLPDKTKDGTSLATVQVVLSLAGKFFVTITLPGLLLMVLELNPTPMRNMGNGWTLCMGRVGAILAPFMLYADDYVKNFSTIVMAVFSLLTAITIVTLPDTRKTTQPQTTEDLRQIMNSRRTKKSTEKNGRINEAFESEINGTQNVKAK